MSKERRLPDKLAVQYRAAKFDASAVDEKKRTVALSFSSETPVERWYGKEILDHDPDSVRMDRLESGAAPLLVNHDMNQHIGVVDSAGIEDKVGRAVVRFGNGALANEKFQDVKDGILRNVSVGYIVHRFEITAEDPDEYNEDDEYRATDWEPVEISLAAAGADPTVGVGRTRPSSGNELDVYPVVCERKLSAAAAAKQKQEEQERSMSTSPVIPQVDVNKARQEAQEGELRRIRNINALATEYRGYLPADQESKWISEGTSERDVREALSQIIIARHKPVAGSPSEVVDLSEGEKKQYSIVRAIQAQLRNESCFEKEVSDQIALNTGRSAKHGGWWVPTSLPTIRMDEKQRAAVMTGQRAPLVAGTAAAGGYTVETEVMPLIEILRNKIVARRMGATLLTGLRDSLLFPKQITAGAGFWVGENPGADVTEQDLSFGSFTMSPKTVMALQKYSRQLMAQATLDIEALVRNDIAAQIAIAIDSAVLNGSGSSGQPLGILNQSGIDVVAIGTNGGNPTFASVIQQETDVATANADIGNLGYVTTPGIRGRLKQTAKLSNTIALPVWDDDERVEGGLQEGEVNGYRAMASNQVPSNLTKGTSSGNCHAVIFGSWDGALIGEWGAMEILADPYTLLGQAMIRLVGWALCDTNLRYIAAWSVIKDALP